MCGCELETIIEIGTLLKTLLKTQSEIDLAVFSLGTPPHHTHYLSRCHIVFPQQAHTHSS